MNFNKKFKGFTLVEMLIVIVIIGVLAAALIPRLTSVRGRANDVARKADIQQLATAIITYQMDNNGRLPDPGAGVSVDYVSGSLLQAGLDGIPQDPTSDNVFAFSGGGVNVTAGQYGYLRVVKDGVPNAGFVLMANSQTAGGSNRVSSGAAGIGEISSDSSTSNLSPCISLTLSDTGVVNNVAGGACSYTSVSELRYIMVR